MTSPGSVTTAASFKPRPCIPPQAFRWGWYDRPCFGYYGGYFQPAPVYPTAALWLTDYVLSANLQRGYAEQQTASAEAGQYAARPEIAQTNAVVLSPEVKQAIAEEVRQQIDAERAAAV